MLSFQQGSPWSNEISLAILNFHESGVMEELETTWIDTKKCDEQNNSPATLGLSHMLGMYSYLELKAFRKFLHNVSSFAPEPLKPVSELNKHKHIGRSPVSGHFFLFL